MKEVINTFIVPISEEQEQKAAYAKIDGVIYVIRHNYLVGTAMEEVDTALNAKIETFNPPVV